MRDKAGVLNVGILAEVVDALGVKPARQALDAVHNVAFFEPQPSKVRTVFAGDAGDEGGLGISKPRAPIYCPRHLLALSLAHVRFSQPQSPP